MASPMRMRGGGADEIDCAVAEVADAAARAGEDAEALAADEDFARLRFGGRFLVALAADLLAAEMGRAAIVAAGAAAGAGDFAARVADDDAAGDASFERLRLLERVLFVRAADFLAAAAGDAGADAFRSLDMGV